MKKFKSFFIKEMKTAGMSSYWITSSLSFLGIIGFLYDGYNGRVNMSIYVYIFPVFATFLVLLPFLVLNFKKRALYDPKLNTIKIQSIQNMGMYMNKMFLVEFDSLLRYRMYLQSVELRQEDKIFIYLEPLDIDFSRWNKLLREMLSDQPIAAITFIKETEGNRIGIKFWTFSSDEGRVIYPLKSQW